MKRTALHPLSIALGFLFLASCNSSTPGVPFPGPVIPPSFVRMFDAQDSSSMAYIMAPPITAPLTPAASFAMPDNNGLSFNTNGVLAATANSTLRIYNPPYSNATAPTVTITGPASTLADPEGVAWDGSGNVWVADESSAPPAVLKFSPPFTAASAPSASNAIATPFGLAINPIAGLMFIGDQGSSHVFVVPAPYTGAASATLSVGNSTPSAIAVDQQGRLFVGFDSGTLSGLINVYLPPFVTGNTAAFTLNAGGGVEALAFDPGQNLYAQLHDGGAGNGRVVVFNGPILGAIGAPSADLGCPPGGCGTAGGLAFGP